jgi:hypothetical protein
VSFFSSMAAVFILQFPGRIWRELFETDSMGFAAV